MQRLVLVLALLGFPLLAAAAPAVTGAPAVPDTLAPKLLWSDSIKGIQARMVTLPSLDPTRDRTFNVCIVFHESGLDTSLGIQHITRAIHFNLSEISVQITDAKGHPAEQLPQASEPTPPGWDLVLPPDGAIVFPIGYGGTSPHLAPGVTPKGKLLHLDSGSEWVLLPDQAPYHITVTLNIAQDPATAIAGAKAWQGSLSLPLVDLPAQ